MRVGSDDHRYEWVEAWAALPDDDARRSGWAHHALGVTRDGHIVGFHPAGGHVVVLDPDGAVVQTLDCGLIEGHGLTLVDDDGTGDEYLWVADCGLKMEPSPESPIGYGPHPTPPAGRVLKVRLRDGEVVAELPTPDHEAYESTPYQPTAVAVDAGGNVWVADGYGASLLHRFDADGRHLLTITGEESAAGKLNCPHGLLIDRRRGDPELYVADRANQRLVVFDLEGAFRREVAKGELELPSALATYRELLVVAELKARVTLLDLDDGVVGHLGANGAVVDIPGWPNSLVDGKVVRQQALTPGRFNSPHGLAIDKDGNLFVSEWLVGGRYTKLEPAPDGSV